MSPERGDIRDHDRLVEALEAYDAAARTKAYPAIYGALRDAAYLCGLPQGSPVIAWSRQRVATYRKHIATVDHAVAYLNSKIEELV